ALMLASRAARRIPDAKTLARVTAGLTGDPVADYVRASWRYARGQAADFDAVAREHRYSLSGMLASYRALLRRLETYGQNRADARSRYWAFSRDYGYTPFRFLAARA